MNLQERHLNAELSGGSTAIQDVEEMVDESRDNTRLLIDLMALAGGAH